MGRFAVAAVALSVVAAAAAFAQPGRTFTAELGWVPIGGAERNDVAGVGVATATLFGSRVVISGTFDGLPAKATGAKLYRGVAKGARGPAGTPAIADLRISADTRGKLSGDVRLTPDQLAALEAGQLYVQIYTEKGVPPDHATLWGWLLP